MAGKKKCGKKGKLVGGCCVVKFKGKDEPVKFCSKELTPAKRKAKIARAKKNLKNAKPLVCTAAWKTSVRKSGGGSGSAKQKAKRVANLLKMCA